MRFRLMTCGLIGCALGLALIGGATAQEGAKVDAAAVYKKQCLMCHGAKGDSKLPGMSFADGQWKHGSSVKEIATVVRDGVEGTAMLPFKGKLTEPEITAVAEHVREFDPRLKSGGSR
jgi:mono/diheme cytochrome c family protein